MMENPRRMVVVITDHLARERGRAWVIVDSEGDEQADAHDALLTAAYALENDGHLPEQWVPGGPVPIPPPPGEEDG
jgi:hypothetical protein